MTHKEFLFYSLDVLDNNKIPYTLIAGTLLGAVREGNFLSNDPRDTDIAIPDSYYWKIREIFDKEIKNNKCKWYAINRKELTVVDNENQTKLDFYFVDNDGYLYSYKPNVVDKKWNHEWRIKFEYNSLFDTIPIYFLGRNVNIPKLSEDILTQQYGKNWKIPDTSWGVSGTHNCFNYDSSYAGFFPAGISVKNYSPDFNVYEIGFACINFERKNSTKRCIISIKKHYPNIKIYVADQDEPSGEMLSFYEENKVEYYFVPKNGLSWCRNFLVEKIKENYVLIGDNDFVFSEEARLNTMLEIVENTSIDILAGRTKLIQNSKETIKSYEKIIYDVGNNIMLVDWNYLYNAKLVDYISLCGLRIGYSDIVFNYFLSTKEFLLKNGWNNSHKIHSEHLDFFLNLKRNTKCVIAFTPDSIVEHIHDEPYINIDQRNRMFYDEIFKKYGIAYGYSVGEKQLLNYKDNKRENLRNE